MLQHAEILKSPLTKQSNVKHHLAKRNVHCPFSFNKLVFPREFFVNNFNNREKINFLWYDQSKKINWRYFYAVQRHQHRRYGEQ